MPLRCLLCPAQHNCHLLSHPHRRWGPLQDHPASPSSLWLCLQDTHGLCQGLLSQHLAWAREVLRTTVSQTTCFSLLPSPERWQMLGVSAPHFPLLGIQSLNQAFPSHYFRENRVQPWETSREHQIFHQCGHARSPRPRPARGFLGEQRRQLITAGPRLVSQQSQPGWLG